MPFRGAASATSAVMAATSSAAVGWEKPGGSPTLLSSPPLEGRGAGEFGGPSPVMLLPRLWGGAATTWWPRWRRRGTIFEPIRPVPPITTIFIPNLLVRSPQAGACDGCAASGRQRVWSTTRGYGE